MWRLRHINRTEWSHDDFSGLEDKACTTKKLVSNADDVENSNNVVEENKVLPRGLTTREFEEVIGITLEPASTALDMWKC